MLVGPATRRQLVDGIGWSQEQYAAWLHDAVENYLLGALAPGPHLEGPAQTDAGDRK